VHDSAPELGGPETLKGRSAKYSIGDAVLKVLNGDPIASVRKIEKETKISASTVSYVLTAHIGCISRRCRLAPGNLPGPQKSYRLRQSHEPLEIL
jgi:hypothetical protein